MIYFISNTDSEIFYHITSNIEIESAIMVHLSKSGSTSETAGNMLTWSELRKSKGLEVGKHSGCVTIKDSNLDKFAHLNKYVKIWHMEVDTGGRTSVALAIGIAPCAFANLDWEQFIRGMSKMDEITRRP